MRDSTLFDIAVETFFEPLARKLGQPLSRVTDGVYEIPSPYFVMRVRLHTGHHRGLNVLLRPTSPREFDENEPGGQLGIGCFVEFCGGDFHDAFGLVSTDEDFMERTRWFAIAAERYGVPYLLGEGKDWEAVKGMVEKKTAKGIEELKKYWFLR
jgi:hypothetical protein